MLENFIYAKQKSLFEEALNNGEVLDEAIVFIEDTKEIWNHGTYFDGSTVDLSNIEASIENILDNIPTKVSQLENDVPYVVDDIIENGVYAVTADGQLVTYDEADETCIAVALIVNDAPTPQRLMIEKNGEANTTSIKAAYDADGASNTDYTYFYWGMYNSDNSSITNFTQTGVGGNSSFGYLPQANGSYADSSYNLSGDYTTWTSGALSDFNGKANTAALLAAADDDSYTTYANMATWCTKFNETPSENQGYSDWYIPAFGQLSLMYLNMTAINNVLTKIGGQTMASSNYWSSSEKGFVGGGGVDFGTGRVGSYFKDYNSRVRLVRDFTLNKPLKERVSEIESQLGDINSALSGKQDKLVSGTNIKTVNGTSLLGSGNIVISGGGGSSAYSEVNHGTSDTTFTLTPNTFHVWDEVTSLTLTLGDETAGVANEFLFQFNSGSTATTLTLPDTLKWANDSVPTIEANKIYQISILKGLASVLVFGNTSNLIDNIATYSEGTMTSGATLTFQYPVASDLTIGLSYAESSSTTISSGETSITIDWFEPIAPSVLYIEPASDSVYNYILA